MRPILVLVIICSLNIAAAHAGDYEKCGDETASDSVKLEACSRVIRSYRPSSSGVETYNNVQGARIAKAGIYDRQEKYALALSEMDAALKLGADDQLIVPMSYDLRTTLLIKMGRVDQAIADISKAIDKKHPFYTDQLLTTRARAWETKGDLDRAIKDYSEIIRLKPKDVSAYMFRANGFIKKGDVSEALADYDAALLMSPNEATKASVYNDRALRWRNLGQYDKALSDYELAIEANPTVGLYFANRGEVRRLKGDLDRAIQDQDIAISVDPESSVSLILRADTLRYKGDYTRALSDYNAALRLTPGMLVPAATGRGLTYEKMGNLPRARSEFKTAVDAGLGKSLTDIYRSAFETAQARLAALDSGAVQPAIPTAPPNVKSELSIPTSTIAVSVPLKSVAPDRPLPSTQQGRRVALVVGNAAYRNVDPLLNPYNDAKAVADSLRNVGFEVVTLANDQTREQMINALRNFANEAEKSDWAMVYYAGHGIEVGGVNYLVPVDATIAVDRDIQFEAVPLSQVLNATDAAKKIKLVVLDACRNNPFKPRQTAAPEVVAASMSTAGAPITTRSVNGRGLAEVKVTGATLVVYAAKDGQVALDGEGGNSPFAVAVVQRLATPGVEINKLFRLVRDDVMEATAGRQEPYTYGSLPGKEDFFFVAK